VKIDIEIRDAPSKRPSYAICMAHGMHRHAKVLALIMVPKNIVLRVC